jgi:hypothetical protein
MKSVRHSLGTVLGLLSWALGVATGVPSEVAALPNIVFVTQPPFPDDYTTTNSTFGNHTTELIRCPRGGDLYIRYADGTLRNLTAEAGFGGSGMLLGDKGISVRDPEMSWDGTKILFSMVVGVPTKRYMNVPSVRWQLYEATGFGKGQRVVITKVPNQPTGYNNVMPAYLSDDRILFVSDRPHDGAAHLYLQRDEYEAAAANTGLFVLDPRVGSVSHMDNAPSGDFDPIVDSYGRVLFTRWDHLQRDQQRLDSRFGAYNYSSEAASATRLQTSAEIFPEPQFDYDPDKLPNLNGHRFIHFFPWVIEQDGTGMETLNHVGRHELFSYIRRTFNDDPNIEEYYGQYSRVNKNSIENFLQIRESRLYRGTYYGVDAPEFGTHSGGQIISMSAPPTVTAGQLSVRYLTPRSTSNINGGADHTRFYRDPLPLSTGEFIASHTVNTTADRNAGGRLNPISAYSFRLKTLGAGVSSYVVPKANLTPGIKKTIQYWNPDDVVTYSNVTMWELQPIEAVARPRPTRTIPPLPSIEQQAFTQAGVSLSEFIAYLKLKNLAVIVSRNVTARDSMDLQQPYNLKVSTSSTQSVPVPGKIYPISFLQLMQGDFIRGYANIPQMVAGRRILPQIAHDGVSLNPPAPGIPKGSVPISADGSVASFVPTRRPLSWHLLDPNGKSVVKERYWVSFQPGEVRVCTTCHGLSSHDQLGRDDPQNVPQALVSLLNHWKGKLR